MVIRLLFFLLLVAQPTHADSLRLIIPDMRPVVGEMIPVTIRGEYTGRISLEKMTFPDSAAYDWIQIARDRWADERVNGKMFRTFERRIAVFPRNPGTLTIGPVSHHLTKASGTTRPEFDVVAPPATLAVAPYPGSGRALASHHVAVSDEFSADPSRLGPTDTITRRITLTASNSMAHLLPPRPLIREPWLISFAAPEVRETRLTAQGPVAVAIWEWSLRPHTGEVGSLMPIQFPWFNTQARDMRAAVTLPIEIGVAGFGDNIGGAAGAARRGKLLLFGLGVAGLVLGVAFASSGRRLAPRRVADRLLRMRRNPKTRALRVAADQGDLMALRSAAEAYIQEEQRLGRAPAVEALDELDRAVFPANAQQDFDRHRFLRQIFGKGAG